MRIGFIATRLSGTDGVSLEVEKWARVLQEMEHELFYCAGELGGYAAGGCLIPRLHFNHPDIDELNQRAFGIENPSRQESDAEKLGNDISAAANEIQPPLGEFIRSNRLDVIIIENALAIPMNLPLGVCLSNLIAELGINAIAHHHDFYWERQRYQANAILDFLDTYFPPRLPNIEHVTINSIAQKRLKARRGIEATVIPNVHDFATPTPEIDEYNADLRSKLDLEKNDILILQPTRVVRRKGIELAIELLQQLERPRPRLYISHNATDEGLAYWHWLTREARLMDVDLRLIDHLVEPNRRKDDGRKIYSLWDVYPHADLITYPSLYEGFGNALLEAIYFKKPVVVNRYPVYNADIKPKGFQFIELDGFVNQMAVQQVLDLLKNPKQIAEQVEKNYHIAQEHFSLQVLEKSLAQLLAKF
jgi:glycosyltransferase involved in cell wall biosynthesis